MHIAFTIPWWVLIVIGGSIAWWAIAYVLLTRTPVENLFVDLVRPKGPGGHQGSTIYRKETVLRCLLLGPVTWILLIAWRGNP